jgi:hypothetical protein
MSTFVTPSGRRTDFGNRTACVLFVMNTDPAPYRVPPSKRSSRVNTYRIYICSSQPADGAGASASRGLAARHKRRRAVRPDGARKAHCALAYAEDCDLIIGNDATAPGAGMTRDHDFERSDGVRAANRSAQR